MLNVNKNRHKNIENFKYIRNYQPPLKPFWVQFFFLLLPLARTLYLAWTCSKNVMPIKRNKKSKLSGPAFLHTNIFEKKLFKINGLFTIFLL